MKHGGHWTEVALILGRPTKANQNLSLWMPQGYKIGTKRQPLTNKKLGFNL